MRPTFSLCINHTPWIPDRVEAYNAMHAALTAGVTPFNAYLLNTVDYRGTDWQQSKVDWALNQWRWAAQQDMTHHVFMTDDLNIAPNFWEILARMVEASPDVPIGLLSNHPKCVEAFDNGAHWYKTNSWLVGPAYVLPNRFLLKFLIWFESLPDGSHLTPGTKAYANDDSTINAFVTMSGLHTMHPLPTIIEHRSDMKSTVGHGDRHSKERISWRAKHTPILNQDGSVDGWTDEIYNAPSIDAMMGAGFWADAANAPLIPVGE